MNSKVDFDNSIIEVDILNEQAKRETSSRTNNEKIYYKAIILLLCAKLEKYVKDSAKEYYTILLSYNMSADKWPEKFILEILENEVNTIKNKGVENYKKDKNDNFKKNLALFWNKKHVINELRDNFSISISNNGTTEFNSVYKKIGFPEIINQLDEFEEFSNDEFGVQTKITIPITDTINKVIYMRHNIIHDDATPQITEKDVEKYIKVFKSFVKQIDSRMEKELEEIKK